MATLTEIPAPDANLVAAALTMTGAAVVDVLRRNRDLSRPVPRLTWDARALVGHLIATTEAYAGIVAGKGSPYTSLVPADIHRISDELSSAAMRHIGDPAAALAEGVAKLAAATIAADPAGTVSWHADTPVPPTQPAAGIVGEYLVHGLDLARAFGERWAIDAGHVDLVVQGIGPMLPHFLSDKGARFTGNFQLKLRGFGTYTFVFADGALRVGSDWDGPVHCRISADPATYVIAAYGRMGPIRPALTGRMVVYGHKPWLGPRFAGLLQAP